jgi:hypothetical protein
MIARTWRGTVRRSDADEYAEYIRERGIAEAALAAGAPVTVAGGSEASHAKAQEEMGPGVQVVEADLASERSLEQLLIGVDEFDYLVSTPAPGLEFSEVRGAFSDVLGATDPTPPVGSRPQKVGSSASGPNWDRSRR